MRTFLKFSAGTSLLLAAATMSLGVDAFSYSTLGFSLPLSQRDVRVFNNFDDQVSNNNLAVDPNWPGYNGAYLAFWKGAAEWGSSSMGDGSGDPTQPNIGDGGANFNPVWNGSATGPGSGWRKNVAHAPDVNGGGSIAWTYPSNDGWLIEFADLSYEFEDGPDTIYQLNMDIQGIAAHEYGHALGLGHSSNPASTMYSTIGRGSILERNIIYDDQNGVQSIYGVKDANMPFIDAILGSTAPGATAVLIGGNFDATDNRIWFNSDVLDDDDAGGEPFKLNNLASSGNGTQVSFTVPNSGIESGAIHAKVVGGKHTLGEGHPFQYGGLAATDTLNLEGPATANGGDNVNCRLSNARPFVHYEIQYSTNLNGHYIGGHFFDLGHPYWIGAYGLTDGFGQATAHRRLPHAAAGKTFYFEATTFDQGVYEDSNTVKMTVL
jgi:hypothetical protein